MSHWCYCCRDSHPGQGTSIDINAATISVTESLRAVTLTAANGTATTQSAITAVVTATLIDIFDLAFIWPFPHRHRHSPWPVDVTELFPLFCCWTLIWLSRHWAWLRRGYWRYRGFIDWLIDIPLHRSRSRCSRHCDKFDHRWTNHFHINQCLNSSPWSWNLKWIKNRIINTVTYASTQILHSSYPLAQGDKKLLPARVVLAATLWNRLTQW